MNLARLLRALVSLSLALKRQKPAELPFTGGANCGPVARSLEGGNNWPRGTRYAISRNQDRTKRGHRDITYTHLHGVGAGEMLPPCTGTTAWYFDERQAERLTLSCGI